MLTNDIVLRPRFQFDVAETKEVLLQAFERDSDTYMVKRLDDHLFIKFSQKQTHFWSPQLHLEIVDTDEGNARIHGLYGPNPTLWTFFMFLHFGVGTLFIIFSIWAYSYASLDRPYAWQLGVSILMVVVWFVLYAFGRAGKRKGRPQMEELHRYMMQVLREA